jgi:hypothetical protein
MGSVLADSHQSPFSRSREEVGEFAGVDEFGVAESVEEAVAEGNPMNLTPSR